ncbi:hypothetical protein DDQ41_20025 [Streptomyces spongiicola]|uniref:Uncharacterized protein n=1 Tax=Streptomyces spongiicola TaxID=1690221 RepID=A0ABN5KKW2_9ACTN|nr:hypothetical protein DDQ41_20025 [Streptomyces spongiicola]
MSSLSGGWCRIGQRSPRRDARHGDSPRCRTNRADPLRGRSTAPRSTVPRSHAPDAAGPAPRADGATFATRPSSRRTCHSNG